MTGPQRAASAVPTDPRRWPLQPLLDTTGLNTKAAAEHLGVSGSVLARRRRTGLTDVQADHWAIRLGTHPFLVWGWAWVDAADQTSHLVHLDIATSLREQINDGRLRPGDELPSVRTIADLWGVGRRTAARAITELRADGFTITNGKGRRDLVAPVAHTVASAS